MKIVTTIFFLFIAISTFSQRSDNKIRIGTSTGLAIFNQSDLSSFNQSVIDNLLFEAKLIDDFKPVIFFGGFAQYNFFKSFNAGPSYEYYHTGSRVGAKDYSGTFAFDQYLKMHQVGVKIDYAIAGLQKTALRFELNLGANFTDWRTESKLDINLGGSMHDESVTNYSGLSWFVSPAVKGEYRIMYEISVYASLAYSFDLMKNYKMEYNNQLDIAKTPHWGGLKFTLGICFNFWEKETHASGQKTNTFQ